MKTNKEDKIAVTLLLSIFSIMCYSPEKLCAQVTIGMAEAPCKAGLLQVKDQSADANNVTGKRGGLILSRVTLVDIQTLEPFVDPTDKDYESEKKLSTGLLVYNMTKSEKLVPGIYYWDGEKWDIVTSGSTPSENSGEINNPEVLDPDIPSDISDPAGLKLPNSYIIRPGKIVTIPVIKAYSVWYQLLGLSESMLKGTLSVDLVWQDRENLIKQVSLDEGDKGSKSRIRIAVNEATKGNAVVAVRVNGVVRWSWHLWITDYDPEVQSNRKIYNNTSFMDRNLGASDTIHANNASLGLLYQWGRKDPFPGSADIKSNKERELFDINGQSVSISKSIVTVSDNRMLATENPSMFYYSTGGNFDWFTNSSNSQAQDNSFWNDNNNVKGVFDPCPKGWRVPINVSVWDGLPTQNFGLGEGAQWNTETIKMGYYPAAGCRLPSSGELSKVGSEGNVWSATPPVYETRAFIFYFAPYNARSERSYRAQANSVRCVKE